MSAELDDVDKTNDVQTQRCLVETLDLRVTLRFDEAGSRWADIQRL